MGWTVGGNVMKRKKNRVPGVISNGFLSCGLDSCSATSRMGKRHRKMKAYWVSMA